MTSRALAAAAVLALAAASAPAESRSEEDATPLGLLRRAEGVALVTAVAPAPGEEAPLGVLRIDEVLRGSLKAGERVLPAGAPDLEDLRAPAGIRAVAFLGRTGGRWTVLDGALGLVATEEVPSGDAPATAFFRALIASLDAKGRIADPARARALLVGACSGASVRLRHGAAMDLVREPALLAGATGEERAALVAAFDALPNRDRARFHLARVVGLLKPEGAAAKLAAALVAGDGEAVADAVGAAVADLGDPKAVEFLAAKAADPSARTRRLVARALGAAESAAARPGLESLLGDAEPATRLEATLGLGRLKSPDAVPALLRRFRGEGAETDALVRRGLAWALGASGETAALEEAARSDGDPAFRRYAGELLRHPSRGFVR